MSRSKELNHLVHLKDEINHLKSLLQPHDTGHIHTTIGVLEERVEEITMKHLMMMVDVGLIK